MLSDYDDVEEKFTRRGPKRKPQSMRRVGELVGETSKHRAFDDPDLQLLFERGVLSELLWQMQSGKEATVYAATGPAGKLAAKIYTDPRTRSFKRDLLYREGRFVSRGRFKKAMQQASRTGLPAEHILWVEDEFRHLKTLHDASVPVPEPIAHEGSVILMGYVGGDHPAPRLADAALSQTEAEDAFAQSLELMAGIARLGLVHGDFSTFNLLWWQGRVIVIDLPQMVAFKANKHASELLERDVASLVKSFRSLGIEAEAAKVLGELRAKVRAARNPGARRDA